MLLVAPVEDEGGNNYKSCSICHIHGIQPRLAKHKSHILTFLHINLSNNSIFTCTTQVDIEKLAIFAIFSSSELKEIGNIHPTPTKVWCSKFP